MKKIDKSIILSTDYNTWLKTLGTEHPEYNSSKNEYYFDIKMSLLSCQKGLCVYTEELLCDEKFFDKDNWDDNKYIKDLTQNDKNEIRGDLEHFDESLKKNQAWLWDNLFIADTHVNCRIKGSKPIRNILKPDAEEYDPYKYLSFDYELGIFSPNVSLSESEQSDVKYMIEILGLNCIQMKRKKQLKDWLDMEEIGMPVKPYQFITAWDMTVKNLTNERI